MNELTRISMEHLQALKLIQKEARVLLDSTIISEDQLPAGTKVYRKQDWIDYLDRTEKRRRG